MSSLTPKWIEQLLHRLAEDTRDDPFLNHQEGHYNLAVANALLRVGAKLQFGTTEGDKADFICRLEGWTKERRVHKLDVGSGDLTIIKPETVCLELKCRPDFGPKAQAAFAEIADDLDRIAGDCGTAFLFSFDQRLYTSFDGTAKRTKPSTTGDLLRAFFPKATGMKDENILTETRTWAESKLSVCSLKTRTTSGNCRFFVFGHKR